MKVFVPLVLTMALLASACLGQQVLFSDDFDSGLDDQWLMPNGGWVIENGRLQNTSTCGFQQCMPDIWSGGESQSDYMISFDLELLEPSPSPHGMALYVYTSMSESCEPYQCPLGVGYAVDVGYQSHASMARMDGNSAVSELAWEPYGEPRCWWNPNILYHVKYGRQGGSLVFNKWTDSEPEPSPLMTAQDDTYSAGFWGVSIWNGMVAIDNFEVTGYGVVSNEDMTWSGVKALYR